LQRRHFLKQLTAFAGVSALQGAHPAAIAQSQNFVALTGDDGKPIVNYRVPVELSVEGLPGIVWAGSATPDVILVEFFDYNCGFCHRAAGELDAILKSDKNVRLGLVNNAIIGLPSILAAKVQQGVLKLNGPQKAYEFHKAMFAHRGAKDGLVALDIAKKLKLDAAAIEDAADGDDVRSVLSKQTKLAGNLGFAATPSFLIKNVGLLGYPGEKSLRKMIAALRSCDKLAC